MFKTGFLAWLAALLLVGLPWLLGAVQPDYRLAQLINELGALDQPGRSLANGTFLLCGAFWMGSVEAVRKQLEPRPMDAWVRFGVIAFAASLIGRMVFPCDLNCPPSGSVTQLVHNSLLWVLYAGAMVAGWRLALAGRLAWLLKIALLVCFVLLQLSFWQRDWWPGLWQRGYELAFAALWVSWVQALLRAERTKA
ncbi:DUF998 domain-containing protein [Saccharospirillum mangrovi]|uniref:DUF998 domain-containing protein n=1 Tax=Saccharospirillum mangrovi TaxID=2161747 RepID=UPI0013005275|nr:DUF998 domain-containing protein [Saccharospirillum mangrovi]